jgi:hypothetical protein
MSRFIAVPVAQGDAFYLEHDDWSVLVDGGRNQSAFPAVFQAATKADGVSVAVCTHNDADHANGIIGLLQAGFRCGEVWLPGRWLAALPNVLKPFVDLLIELAADVAQVDASSNTAKQQSGLSPIEALGEDLHEHLDEGPMGNESLSIGEDGWPEPYVSMLERAEPWEVAPWVWLWASDDLRFFPYRHYQRLDSAGMQLLWSAIDAASRIRAIALEAFHRGIPVQWFEFGATKPLDGVATLRPLNARVVARVRPRVRPLLASLALTVSNKESLVFWSPPTDHYQGVLFTADSDLSGVDLSLQLSGAIATAPHHGSEANAKAYTAIATAMKGSSSSITWVRSDGRYRDRPGPTYCSLSSRRLCTLCQRRGSTPSPKQSVHLFTRGAMWTRHRRTAVCSCKPK